MSWSDVDTYDATTPRRHSMSRRIVAAVAIVALVLSALGVGYAIAQYQWGPPRSPVEQQEVNPGVDV